MPLEQFQPQIQAGTCAPLTARAPDACAGAGGAGDGETSKETGGRWNTGRPGSPREKGCVTRCRAELPPCPAPVAVLQCDCPTHAFIADIYRNSRVSLCRGGPGPRGLVLIPLKVPRPGQQGLAAVPWVPLCTPLPSPPHPIPLGRQPHCFIPSWREQAAQPCPCPQRFCSVSADPGWHPMPQRLDFSSEQSRELPLRPELPSACGRGLRTGMRACGSQPGPACSLSPGMDGHTGGQVLVVAVGSCPRPSSHGERRTRRGRERGERGCFCPLCPRPTSRARP